MNAGLKCCLAGLLLLAAQVAPGGERVTAEFFDPSPQARAPEVLPGVPLKAVVAEFLDPLDTGLGKALGYLFWYETLTAISDQAGAGVIVAQAPPGERLADLLQRDYHLAAERIARHQGASMALWGVVEPDGDGLMVETYLSIDATKKDGALRLALGGRERGHGPTWHDRDEGPRFEAALQRQRFSFAPLFPTRSELFERTLVTAVAVAVRQAPNAGAAVMQRVEAGRVLQSVDMRDSWFEVILDDGRRGFVDGSGIGRLRLPPPRVVADRERINLRAGPGTDHRVVRNRDLQGEFRVLDMRYRRGHGLWYRIDIGEGRPTWVAAWLVRPRFALPMVHFLAGLYRYYGERPADAVEAFRDFIAASGDRESHVVRASAWQALGACRMRDGQSAGAARSALADFERAIELTPFDPNAYLLRAVAALGGGQPRVALRDLDAALGLDPAFAPARELALAMARLVREPGMPPLLLVTGLHATAGDLDRLLDRYAIDVGPDTTTRPDRRPRYPR
jgi:tetratricopeptide (TPR) repeat protein